MDERLAQFIQMVPPGTVITDAFVMVGFVDEDGIQQYDWHIAGSVPNTTLIGRLFTIMRSVE